MKSLFILCFSLLLTVSAAAQIEQIADKVLLLKGELNVSKAENLRLDTLWKALKFYRTFEKKESMLNGRANFGFTGNESERNNIYKLNAGVVMDHGLYPFELDLKAQFQMLLNNGAFQENISDVDISFDYHVQAGDGLFLENFAVLKRFNNTYLGIDQRYEAGAGVIFNFFSKNNLTDTGTKNHQKLAALPAHNLDAGSIWQFYQTVYEKIPIADREPFQLTETDLAYLKEIRYKFDKANKKDYSKIRLALLIGVYYESETAKAERELFFNGQDTLFSIDFAPTNKFRWELRPTFVFRPNDVFTFKFYPYFKLPLTKWYDEVVYDETIADRRVDKFYDFQASIRAKITSKISMGIRYRYFKDFAPKRAYVLNANDEPVLVVGQETNSFYNINFLFGF